MHISSTCRSEVYRSSRSFQIRHSFRTRPYCQSRVYPAFYSCRLRASSPQDRNSLPVTEEHRSTQKQLGLLGLSTVAPSFVSLPANAGVIDGIQKDTVISAAFTVAVVALGAVTIGVLYLSTLTFLDGRKEKEERKQFEKALQDKEARAAAGGNKSSKPKQQKKKKSRTSGFG